MEYLLYIAGIVCIALGLAIGGSGFIGAPGPVTLHSLATAAHLPLMLATVSSGVLFCALGAIVASMKAMRQNAEFVAKHLEYISNLLYNDHRAAK